MTEKINKKIQAIHNSRAFGVFFEVGAGLGICNSLYSMPGASNTIKSVYSPYSRDLQEEEFPLLTKDIRSVSKKAVEIFHGASDFSDPKVNLKVFASSQVGEGICNHGWLCIEYNDEVNFYHVTANTKESRGLGAEELNTSFIDIIHATVCLEGDLSAGIEGLDLAFNSDGTTLSRFLLNTNNRSFVVYRPDGKLERLEKFFRGHEEIILFQGSFNPVHEAHFEIMESVQRHDPNTPKAFSITLSNFDKSKNPLLTTNDIISRIKKLNEAGHYVIVARDPLFAENVKLINERLNTRVVLPMGYDTFERCTLSHFDNLNCRLVVFDRDNHLNKDDHVNNRLVTYVHDYHNPVSSTEIREAEAEV